MVAWFRGYRDLSTVIDRSCSSVGKESACNVGDPGSIPGSGRSPGEGNGNPLQYSSLENSMDGGAWWATVHGVAKSWTQLSNFTSSTRSLVHLPFEPAVMFLSNVSENSLFKSTCTQAK